MKISNLYLTHDNIAPDRSDPSLAVIDVAENFEWKDGKKTGNLLGFKVDVAVRKYDQLTVKVPASLSEKIDIVQTALENDDPVRVIFEGLRLKPYIMQGKDGVRSGVSAMAEDFEIVNEIDELSDNLEEDIS